jgi:hypothetical protein
LPVLSLMGPGSRQTCAACVQPAPKSRLVVSDLLRYEDQKPERAYALDRSHAPRGNAATDALRQRGRGASWQAFPRRARERSKTCRIALALGRTRTICREPAANPVCAVYLTLPRCLALLVLRSRSRARWNATPGRSYALRSESKSGQPRGSLFAWPWLLMLEQSN